MYIIVLIIRGCFHRTHDLNKLFLHLMRALLLHNYDKLSRIFSYLLLIRNHTIFLVQLGINEHEQNFSKDHKLQSPYGRVEKFNYMVSATHFKCIPSAFLVKSFFSSFQDCEC